MFLGRGAVTAPLQLIGYKMKMQIREILILAAVDDQPVGGQVGFFDQALGGGDDIGQESGKRLFGNQQNMIRVGRSRVAKGQERVSFS